jgi:hypothetical protein
MRRTPFLILVSLFACTNLDEHQIGELDSPTAPKSQAPYLFKDSHDQVFLSWIEEVNDMAYLKISQLHTNTWSDAKTISSGTGWFINWADYPIGAADGNGNFIHSLLVKSGHSTYAYDVKLFTSKNTFDWTAPKLLHHDSTQTEHGFVSILPYENGFLTAWLDGRNTAGNNHHAHNHDHDHHAGAMTLRAAILDTNADKIIEWELDDRVCDCCQTTAALTSNGPVVIYRNRSDEEIRDIYISRLIDNNWTIPKSIYNDKWEVFGCPVNGPRADALANTLGVAWFTAANDNAQVKVIFSKDGGATFAPPIIISENEAIGRVDLVMLDEESAMISWMEGKAIKAMRVYSNGQTEKPLIISTSTAKRASGFPQMLKADNRIIFAWTDEEEGIIKTANLSIKK